MIAASLNPRPIFNRRGFEARLQLEHCVAFKLNRNRNFGMRLKVHVHHKHAC